MVDRITFHETLYFEASGQDPVSWETHSERGVTTPEQAYQRRIKVGPNWIDLDSGWIVSPGLVYLRHESPTYIVLPTEEQRQADRAKLLQVRTSPQEEGWLIPVGESFRGLPADPKSLQIRCVGGEARCTLVILPR